MRHQGNCNKCCSPELITNSSHRQPCPHQSIRHSGDTVAEKCLLTIPSGKYKESSDRENKHRLHSKRSIENERPALRCAKSSRQLLYQPMTQLTGDFYRENLARSGNKNTQKAVLCSQRELQYRGTAHSHHGKVKKFYKEEKEEQYNVCEDFIDSDKETQHLSRRPFQVKIGQNSPIAAYYETESRKVQQEGEHAKLLKKIEKYRRKVQKSEVVIQQLEEQNHSVVQEYKGSLAKYESLAERMKVALEEKEKIINKLSVETDQLSNTVSEYSRVFEGQKRQLGGLKRQLDMAEDKLNRYEAVDSLQRQLSEVKITLSQKEREVNKLNSDLSHANQNISRYEHSIREKQAVIRDLSEFNNELCRKMMDLKVDYLGSDFKPTVKRLHKDQPSLIDINSNFQTNYSSEFNHDQQDKETIVNKIIQHVHYLQEFLRKKNGDSKQGLSDKVDKELTSIHKLCKVLSQNQKILSKSELFEERTRFEKDTTDKLISFETRCFSNKK